MNEERFEVAGLRGTAEVLVDKWGVPHITADNADDLFFAQGFVAAKSRLFQIDWWRRRGLGKIAEVLGDAYVERDRAARLFIYRGDMRAEWLAYGDDAKRIVTAFTQGINAWIGMTERDPSLLSVEFVSLGYTPELWEPEDVVRLRSHGIFSNLEHEVARAITLRDYGGETEELRKSRNPWHPLVVPDGLDLSLIHPGILDVYRRGMGPVSVLPETNPPLDGSNNWVISGQRTATGRPILANDPHRAMTMPSLRYVVHLKCPDFDAIGAGEPALPGISVGHNGNVAFGLTIWNVDQEDLYVYEVHPTDDHLYRYRDSWERMERQVESILLPDGRDQSVELLFTRHGPILLIDGERRVAYALRAGWLQPGMAPYLASLGNLYSRDGNDVRRVFNRWGAPGVNHVYADTKGEIGWTPRALVPIRPNWDGLLPVPGDGRYEWAGFQHASALPQIVSPEKGWLGSANQMNLPQDGSWSPVPVSNEWYAPYRWERITEVLNSDDAVTVERAAKLQNDYVSLPARRICELLTSMSFGSQTAESGRALLVAWDNAMTSDSSAATLFEGWLRGSLRQALRRQNLAEVFPPEKLEEAVAASMPKEDMIGDIAVDMDLLNRLAGDKDALSSLLERTLEQAVKAMHERFGSDPADWAWGRTSMSRFTHLAAAHLDKVEPWAQIGPKPKSGSSETVGLAVQGPDGVQVTGASFRMVIDVGAWDNSVAINSPGQDGDPSSPHYNDLHELWLKDGHFPLLYSRSAIVQNLTSIFTLGPSSDPGFDLQHRAPAMDASSTRRP